MSGCYTSRAEKEKSWKVIFDISKLFRDSAFLSSQQIEDYRKDGIVVVDRYNFGIAVQQQLLLLLQWWDYCCCCKVGIVVVDRCLLNGLNKNLELDWLNCF